MGFWKQKVCSHFPKRLFFQIEIEVEVCCNNRVIADNFRKNLFSTEKALFLNLRKLNFNLCFMCKMVLYYVLKLS